MPIVSIRLSEEQLVSLRSYAAATSLYRNRSVTYSDLIRETMEAAFPSMSAAKLQKSIEIGSGLALNRGNNG